MKCAVHPIASMRAFATRCLWLALLLFADVAALPVQLVSTALPTPVSGDGFSGDSFGIAVAIDGTVAVIGAYGDTHVSVGATFGVTQGSAYVFELVGGSWTRVQKLLPQPIGGDSENFGAALAIGTGYIAVGAPRRNPDDRVEAGSVYLYVEAGQGYQLSQILVPGPPDSGQRFGAAVALWQDYLAVAAPQAGDGRVDLYRRDAGGTYAYQRSLFPQPGDAGAQFGAALAMTDARLLIGAPQAPGGGAVYQSRLVAGWTDASRLPLPASAGEQLGASLAIADAMALVGAPGLAAGAVRVLAASGDQWSQAGVLLPQGGAAGDHFGSALVLDSGRAAIAAVDALGSQGRVHLYGRTGAVLAEVDQVDIAGPGQARRFGASLALGQDGVLVGADLDRVGPNRGQGSARWLQPAGDGYAQTAQLDSGDGAMYDRYGSAVAVDGDIALVGAYLEDTDAGADAGAAHWFERVAGGWQYRGQLLAPDGDIEDRFGIAVDVDAGRMAIGAFWDVIGSNVDQGSVYIYRREGEDWVFEAKLTASDGRRRDYFGFALALDGDRLLVGARGATIAATEQGVAYLFERSGGTWQQRARLDPPVAQVFGYFGTSVALDGDLALVGAPGATVAPGPDSAGAAFAYVPRDGQWLLAATLQAPVPQANSAFGFSVAMTDTRLLVGAFQDGSAGQGAAYVYRSVDFTLDGELRAGSAQFGEALGIAVAMHGNTAVLGASGYDLGPQGGVGTVRTFSRGAGGWAESGQWFAIDAAAGDAFGRALAFDGQHAVIGAPMRGVDNPLEGHAYVQAGEALFADGFE